MRRYLRRAATHALIQYVSTSYYVYYMASPKLRSFTCRLGWQHWQLPNIMGTFCAAIRPSAAFVCHALRSYNVIYVTRLVHFFVLMLVDLCLPPGCYLSCSVPGFRRSSLQCSSLERLSLRGLVPHRIGTSERMPEARSSSYF